MNEEQNIDYNAEVIRKGIHLCSLSIPIIYFYITRDTALMILLPVAFLFISADVLRMYHKPSAELFYKMFKWMLRRHETDEQRKRLNGASNVFISATLCIILFPKIIVLTCFPILIISDSVAALFGRRFGKRKFLDKSMEGSLAFFLSAILVVLLTPKATHANGEYFIGVVGALTGAIVEAIPSIKIDDNLSIHLSIGIIMWGLYSLMYPTLNLFTITFGHYL